MLRSEGRLHDRVHACPVVNRPVFVGDADGIVVRVTSLRRNRIDVVVVRVTSLRRNRIDVQVRGKVTRWSSRVLPLLLSFMSHDRCETEIMSRSEGRLPNEFLRVLFLLLASFESQV